MARDLVPDAVHVLETANLVFFLEGHLDGGRIRPGVAAIEGREARGDPDVRDDHFQVAGIDAVTDEVLHLGDVLLGELEPRAGGDFQIDGELSGVGPREEGQAEKRVQSQAGYEESS